MSQPFQFLMGTFVLLLLGILGSQVSSAADEIPDLIIPVVVQNATQPSVKLADTIVGTCYRDADCWAQSGYNSRCYTNQCICNLGFRPINYYCTKVSCNTDADCTRYFYNTRCGLWSSCTCVSGTHLDNYSQTCLYNSGGGGVGFSVGFPVGIVAFLVVVALISCCVIRQRRMRTLRRVPAPVVFPQPQPPPGTTTTHVMLSPASGQVPPYPYQVQQPYQGTQQHGYIPAHTAPNYYPQVQPQPNQQSYPAPPPYNPGFQAAASSGGGADANYPTKY